jgi:MFS family permease
LGLAFFQQISGINAIFYYAPMIFGLTGGGQDSAFMQAIILGVVNVVLTVVAMFLIDKWGRKPLLLTGSAIITVCLALAGFTFANAKYHVNDNNIKQIVCDYKNGEYKILASAIDPLNYKLDSIAHKDNMILIYRAGNVTATFNANDEKLLAIDKAANSFGIALESMKGTYHGERAFFNTFDTKLNESGAGTVEISMIKANSTSLIRDKSIEINSLLVLIAIIGFLVGFAISLGPVMWAMLSEIFPNKYRGIALSIAGTFNAITSTFVAFVFPIELEQFGAAATFLIYAGFIFVCFFFVLAFCPETKGKSLEQLEEELIK